MTFLRSHIRSYLIAACICFFILQFFNRIEYPVNSAEIELYMAPADSIGQEPMPLITLGDGRAYGGFFLQKLAPDRGRVGYFSSQGSILYSDPFSITAGTLHKVHISMQELVRKGSLNVSVDGTRVLGTSLACPNITSTQHVIGQNQVIQGLAKQFNGILLPANSPTLERVNYPFGISPYLAPLTIAALMLALVYLCLQNFLRTLALPPAVIYTYIFCLFTYIAQVTDWTFAILYPDVGLASFYDYQLQSLLQGHWDVPFQAISYEAFIHEGKYYGYFGPTPAFMRLPVTFFPEMYGYWTRLMMSVAHAVSLAFLVGIARHLWNMFQENRPNPQPAPAFFYCFSLLLYQFGTPAFYIASSASVYFEAITCATVLSCISVYFSLQFCEFSTNRSACIAILCGALAFMSRVTLGAFPLLFFGCIILWKLYTSYKKFKYTQATLLLKYVSMGVLTLFSLTTFHIMLYIKFDTFQFPYSKNIQITGKRLDNIKGKTFYAENILYNTTAYLLTPLKLTPEYPFILPTSLSIKAFPEAKIDKLAFADRDATVEEMPGLLFSATTAIILSICSIVYFSKLPGILQIIGSASAISFFIILCPLLLATSNNYRYINDAFLSLYLLSMLGFILLYKYKNIVKIFFVIVILNGIINLSIASYNTGIYFTSDTITKTHYKNRILFSKMF